MPTLHAKVVFPTVGGLPRDDTINTWNFTTTGGTAAEGGESIRDRLADFYSMEHGESVNSLLQYLANWSALAAAYIQVYDTSEPEPRVPVYQDSMGWIDDVGVQDYDLPQEVAICMSYRATVASGAPAARRKGRVYLGPLNAGALQENPAVVPRPAPALLDLIRDAGDWLLDQQGTGGVGGVAALRWVVWSRTDNVMAEVVGGWVDNAFDTQRRRGRDATARLNFQVG